MQQPRRLAAVILPAHAHVYCSEYTIMRRVLTRRIGVVFIALVVLSQHSLAQNVERPARSARPTRERPPRPVAIADGKITLTPQNTTIQFVGTHTGDEPNPRTGYFTKFTGELAIDEATKTLTAATLGIDTTSLVTEIDRLTRHLHSADFFDVREYPKGDLTIREVTKPIVFPTTLRVTDAGATLTSRFKIKRSEFGMTFGPDRVDDEVSLAVTVGRPTPKVTPQ
jgi:polyisoprenoid-binding protein YceI